MSTSIRWEGVDYAKPNSEVAVIRIPEYFDAWQIDRIFTDLKISEYRDKMPFVEIPATEGRCRLLIYQ